MAARKACKCGRRKSGPHKGTCKPCRPPRGKPTSSSTGQSAVERRLLNLYRGAF